MKCTSYRKGCQSLQVCSEMEAPPAAEVASVSTHRKFGSYTQEVQGLQDVNGLVSLSIVHSAVSLHVTIFIVLPVARALGQLVPLPGLHGERHLDGVGGLDDTPDLNTSAPHMVRSW